jgi:hypothetical protein
MKCVTNWAYQCFDVRVYIAVKWMPPVCTVRALTVLMSVYSYGHSVHDQAVQLGNKDRYLAS